MIPRTDEEIPPVTDEEPIPGTTLWRPPVPKGRYEITSDFHFAPQDGTTNPLVVFRMQSFWDDAPEATVIALEVAEWEKMGQQLLMGAKYALARATHPAHRAFLRGIIKGLGRVGVLQEAVDLSIEAMATGPEPFLQETLAVDVNELMGRQAEIEQAIRQRYPEAGGGAPPAGAAAAPHLGGFWARVIQELPAILQLVGEIVSRPQQAPAAPQQGQAQAGAGAQPPQTGAQPQQQAAQQQAPAPPAPGQAPQAPRA